MIVIDSSAIVAVLRNEPDTDKLLARMAKESVGERRSRYALNHFLGRSKI